MDYTLFENQIKQQTKRSEEPRIVPALNHQNQTTCDYHQFIGYLRRILSNVMPECDFVDADRYKQLSRADNALEKPVITYKVHLRHPLKEQKPTMRYETFEDTSLDNEKRIGALYAWRMHYTLHFSIIDNSSEQCEKIMTTFEEVIFRYIGFLKEKGVSEVLFKKQFEDNTLNNYREYASVRTLEYEVILEKFWIDFESVLEVVTIESDVL